MSTYEAHVRPPPIERMERSVRPLPALGDYATRRRFTSFDAAAVRGVSRESALFELIYASDWTSPVPEVVEHTPIYEPLVRLLHLEDGWDGHGAPAPSRAAIDVARAVLQEATQRPDLDKARVTADVEGGVAIYFFGGPRLPDGGLERQAGVLVDNDGDGVLYMRDRSRPGSAVDDVRSDTDALRDVLGRIATFLSGM